MKLLFKEGISAKEAAEIISRNNKVSYSLSQVQRVCRKFLDTKGKKGLRCQKLGRDWLVDRKAAEMYEPEGPGHYKRK